MSEDDSPATTATRGLRRELARVRLVEVLRLARVAIEDYNETDPAGLSCLAILDSAALQSIEALEPPPTEPCRVPPPPPEDE